MKLFRKCTMLFPFAVVAALGVLLFVDHQSVQAQEVDSNSEKFKRDTVYWLGTLDAGAIKLRMRIDVHYKDDGSLNGQLVSIDQGGAEIPLDSLAITDDEFSFSVERLKIQYQAKPDQSGESVTGTFSQGGASYEMTLKKVTKDEAAAPKRPQTPTAPFPYEAREVLVANDKATAVTLAGWLTLPNENKGERFPAVVLVSGSGPQDRDETLLGHKPFWVIADYLSRRGIAVLRYDDRGIGKSTGEFSTATTQDFASDAQAAIGFLSSIPEIDSQRIGVIGHSEGGIVAAMLAASESPPAHAVMLAGTGVPGDEILLTQGDAIFKRSGAAEPEAQRELRKDLISLSKTGARSEEMQKRADRYFEEEKNSVQSDAADDAEQKSAEKEQLRAGIAQFANPWFRFFLNHDPRLDLRRAKCPVFALIGENDLQVLIDINMPEIEKALAESATKGHQCERFDGLNHLFQHSESGLPAEYGTIEETFAPEVLEKLYHWVHRH